MDEDYELMQFFQWAHLPFHLQQVSQPFQALAQQLTGTLPPGRERSMFLRKLLEAKDCAVRAALGSHA